MGETLQNEPVNRLLVVMPSWVGDTVMATPTLRALRSLYPDAHIAALVRDTVRPILDACPWIDRMVTARRRRRGGRARGLKGLSEARRNQPFRLARLLAAGRFDTAVLLPNSFRSALLIRTAGIPRRVGYDRDGRGFLLTDRLLPRRVRGRFIPVPTRDYYLGLSRYLGSVEPDPSMRLFTRSQHDDQADELLRGQGFDPDGSTPLVLINPGANYGDAKIWYPERFAAVADRCVQEFGATVAITGAPGERAILDRVLSSAKHPMIDLPRVGIDLTLLKSVVKRSRLMITNDTGPRHIAAAMDVPVVTIFGPTDPAWTENNLRIERQVRVDVYCGPCQKKKCPLDHRCMTRVTPDMVFDQARQLLEGGKEPGPTHPPGVESPVNPTIQPGAPGPPGASFRTGLASSS